MSQFDLLWNTFDFFTDKSYELEKNMLFTFRSIKNLLKII